MDKWGTTLWLLLVAGCEPVATATVATQHLALDMMVVPNVPKRRVDAPVDLGDAPTPHDLASPSDLRTVVDKCAGVVCAALDQCHQAGVCDPQTGACTQPAKTNGALCDDNNLCTQLDFCQAGVCVGQSPVNCSAQDGCHSDGVCIPSTGICTKPLQPEGTVCTGGTCRSGVCSAVPCTGKYYYGSAYIEFDAIGNCGLVYGSFDADCTCSGTSYISMSCSGGGSMSGTFSADCHDYYSGGASFSRP